MLTTLSILRSPPACPHRLRYFALSSLLDAILLWLVLAALDLYTLHHLPLGETFIFAPRGLGLVQDALTHIGLFTGMFILYCVPSFSARPWLGWLYRTTMFGLFVVALTFLVMIKIIAVVQTPDHKTIFFPRFPLAARTYDRPPNAEYRRNAIVASIIFLTDHPDDLVLNPVSNLDPAGLADIERLKHHINIVKTTE